MEDTTPSLQVVGGISADVISGVKYIRGTRKEQQKYRKRNNEEI
jgi:hypothetical protein